MPQNDQDVSESTASKTAKYIAFSMIGIYGILLIGIGVIAAYKTGDDGKAWTEILKSGFLILGGGLTTIIGYYFGSRVKIDIEPPTTGLKTLKFESGHMVISK